MNNINVSCIVTVGKYCLYLKESIISLLKQSYQNIEVIVINDGDNIEVKEIINDINSNKIKLFNYSKIGRGKSLNYGIKLSKGKYIVILDSDDLSHYERIKFQLNVIIKGFDIVTTDFITNIDELKKIKISSYSESEILYRQFIFRNPICHSSVMIRKSVLIDNNYSEERVNLFDYDLWIRLAKKKLKFVNINEKLTFKRIHKFQHYENKNRLFYVYSTFILKLKAYKLFNKSFFDLVILLLSSFYSLLPQKLRYMFMGKF